MRVAPEGLRGVPFEAWPFRSPVRANMCAYSILIALCFYCQANTDAASSGGDAGDDFLTGFGDGFADDDAPPPPPPKTTKAEFTSGGGGSAGGADGDDLGGFDGFGGSWGDGDAAAKAAAESEDDASTDYEGYEDDAGGGGGGVAAPQRRVAAQLDLYYNPEDLAGGAPNDVDIYAVVEAESWPVELYGEQANSAETDLTLQFSDKLELRSGSKSVPIHTFSVVHVIEEVGGAATAAIDLATTAETDEFLVFIYKPNKGTSTQYIFRFKGSDTEPSPSAVRPNAHVQRAAFRTVAEPPLPVAVLHCRRCASTKRPT